MKTLMILALAASANALSASFVCDAVLDANRRTWGVEINIVSAGNTDCFYAVNIAGATLLTDRIEIVDFLKPSRLRINGCLPARDLRVNCVLGLAPGGAASILLLAPRSQTDDERCVVITARAQPNILAFGRERDGGRDQQTVCF